MMMMTELSTKAEALNALLESKLDKQIKNHKASKTGDKLALGFTLTGERGRVTLYPNAYNVKITNNELNALANDMFSSFEDCDEYTEGCNLLSIMYEKDGDIVLTCRSLSGGDMSVRRSHTRLSLD
jgi:hypothetical protein